MSHVRSTAVAVEKRYVLQILSHAFSLRYPAWNAHVPYCHLWPGQVYIFFSHYLLKGKIFEKKLLDIKSVFWFSAQILSETFLILRILEWVMFKNVNWSSCKLHIILVRFECRLNFSRQTFKKYSDIKFYINLSRVTRVVPRGQTARHDGANSRFSKFCERAYKCNALAGTVAEKIMARKTNIFDWIITFPFRE